MNHLKEFQKKQGLKADGIIGRETLKKFREVYGPFTDAQLAHFLANVHHETGGFIADTENLNYSAQGLASTWPSRYATFTKRPNDFAKKLAGRPEAIANNVYADRMGNGNEASGDGWKYRGRGSLQLTGKNNYELFSLHMKNPKILSTPEVVATNYFWESAIFYFTRANLWKQMKYTDPQAVKAVRKGVNGGYIGLDDVKNKFTYYYNLITK